MQISKTEFLSVDGEKYYRLILDEPFNQFNVGTKGGFIHESSINNDINITNSFIDSGTLIGNVRELNIHNSIISDSNMHNVSKIDICDSRITETEISDAVNISISDSSHLRNATIRHSSNIAIDVVDTNDVNIEFCNNVKISSIHELPIKLNTIMNVNIMNTYSLEGGIYLESNKETET